MDIFQLPKSQTCDFEWQLSLSYHKSYDDRINVAEVTSIQLALKSGYFDRSMRALHFSQLTLFEETKLDRLERSIECCLLHAVKSILETGVNDFSLFIAMKELFGPGKLYPGSHLTLDTLQLFRTSIKHLKEMNWLQFTACNEKCEQIKQDLQRTA